MLCGPEGARRLDVSGKAHGLLARLYRFIEEYGDVEQSHLKRYEQELLAGLASLNESSQGQSAASGQVLLLPVNERRRTCEE
jgi:hypothetical protein